MYRHEGGVWPIPISEPEFGGNHYLTSKKTIALNPGEARAIKLELDVLADKGMAFSVSNAKTNVIEKGFLVANQIYSG